MVPKKKLLSSSEHLVGIFVNAIKKESRDEVYKVIEVIAWYWLRLFNEIGTEFTNREDYEDRQLCHEWLFVNNLNRHSSADSETNHVR